MRAETRQSTPAAMLVRVGVATLLTAITLAWGCADFESTVDPTGGGCHSLNSARADLVLASGHAYDSIVNKPSFLNPALDRIEPGDAASSWLVIMIEDDDDARLHYSRMPLGGQPLTPNQIATIVNWVENGALRN